jgi:predicted  nucleic acid-binding Zn-ribbon protein
MIHIHFLKQQLDPEQNKLLEEVLHERELTLQRFKNLRKKYSGLKSNVKRIEKKLLIIMQQLPEETFIPRWIQNEIESIEKKYSGIDKAIEKYKSSQLFNEVLKSVNFTQGNSPEQFKDRIRRMRGWLSTCGTYIFSAEDDIRITKRYFKNIRSAFEAHARSFALKKEIARRQAGQATNQ